jgi:adenine specific DNA methylase Mod
MHVENDLVEFVTIDDPEYEEIVEEYEEEIFVSEEFLEPPVTDTTNTAPTQVKP